MSAPISLPLVVLWEDEIRTAARLLREADLLVDCGDETKISAAQQAAWNACCIALYGAEIEGTGLVMLASSGLRRKVES